MGIGKLSGSEICPVAEADSPELFIGRPKRSVGAIQIKNFEFSKTKTARDSSESRAVLVFRA